MLTDHPHLDPTDISVEVREGVVTFSGDVDDRFMKREVEEMAWRVRGVCDVNNHLRVRQSMRSPMTTGASMGSASGGTASGSGATAGTPTGTGMASSMDESNAADAHSRVGTRTQPQA